MNNTYRIFMQRTWLPVWIGLICLLPGAVTPALSATPSDPAAIRVQLLNDGLIAAAKGGELHGPKVHQLVDQAFNFAIMAQVAVGTHWADFSAAEKAAVIESLARYTEAREAYEFHDFSGGPIKVDSNVQLRGVDKLVRAEVPDPPEPTLQLIYRLRQYGPGWQIIDVIYNGVSQLAVQRADFANSMTRGGAKQLIKDLDIVTARLQQDAAIAKPK